MPRHLTHQFVADLVPAVIIDHLELVEIDIHQHMVRGSAFGVIEQHIQLPLKLATIAQARQVIVTRVVRHGLDQLAALGHITHDANDHRRIDLHPVHADLDPPGSACAGTSRVEPHRPAGYHLLKLLLEQPGRPGVSKVVQDGDPLRVADQFRLGDAEPFDEMAVGDKKLHFVTDNEDPVVGAVNVSTQQFPVEVRVH